MASMYYLSLHTNITSVTKIYLMQKQNIHTSNDRFSLSGGTNNMEMFIKPYLEN